MKARLSRNFEARIGFKGRMIYLRSFPRAELAHQAYILARSEIQQGLIPKRANQRNST